MNVIPCELRERAEGRVAMGEITPESRDYRLLIAAAVRIESLEMELDESEKLVDYHYRLSMRRATKCDLLLARLTAAVGVLGCLSDSEGNLIISPDKKKLEAAFAVARAQE